MGRTRPKAKIHTKVTNPPEQHASLATPAKKPSIPSLLAKAQEFIIQCDYELALRFIRRVLEQQPYNVEAGEMLGVSLLETGETIAAKEAFQTLVQPPSPQPPPPSAHLYLAQLSDDDPRLALRHYQAAVEILLNQLKGKQSTQNASPSSTLDEEIKGNIVRALVGQVEIWMDPSYDLCFEPEAEKTCEDLLDLALRIDPDNSEALQSLASVRMSQQRPDEAKRILEQVWTKWRNLELDDPALPPIPNRLSLVKLFLELELYSPALLALQGIMTTDDQEVEAWYLEGWCFFLMSESAKESSGKVDDMNWEELAKDSRDCLETCQVLHISQDHPDKPILEHTQELIGKLEALGIKASPVDEDEQGGDNDGDWEDVSENDDGDVQMA